MPEQESPDPMASPLANFFRTAPGFSLIYGAGRRTGEVVYSAGRATAGTTGIRPTIPAPSETPSTPIEKAPGYFIYEAMHGAGEWWGANIETPFERHIGSLTGVPGFEQMGQMAAGLVSSPRLAAELVGMVPPGTTRLASEMGKDPTSLLGFVAAGLTLQGKSIAEGITQKPARFAGEMIGTTLILEGMSRGARVGYEAISPRITEASIMLRTSPKSWGATHATVNLFKDVFGIESRLRAEPDLGLVRNIGERGPAITKFISEEPHTIFGRTTEIGQMPREMFEARGGTKDIDIFTTDIKKFQEGAVKTLGRDFTTEGNLIARKAGGTAMDIHAFPEKYPVGEFVPEDIAYDVAKPALNPLPKTKADLLFGENLVQEKLYVQAQRKATSAIGETTGLIEFRQGPQLHRLKDVYDLVRTSSYLGQELEAKIGTMSKFDPRYALGKFKIQRIKSSIEGLQRFYGAPENVARYGETGELSKAIREFNYGKLSKVRIPSGAEREVQFIPPKGYVHPLAGPRSPSLSRSALPSMSALASVSRLQGISPSGGGRSPSMRSTSPGLSSVMKSISLIRSPGSIRSSTSQIPSGSILKSLVSRSPSISRSPSFSPSRSPSPSRGPSYIPSRSPPYRPPPSATITIPSPRLQKNIVWLPEKEKQLFKRTASAADIGWKITNPVPTLKNLKLPNFGKVAKRRQKK